MPRFADVDMFFALTRVGSFAEAAQELGVTRNTVHRAVGRLEAHFGTALVVRDGRNGRLTEAGARYRHHVRQAARHLREAEAAMATVPPGRGQQLVVAVRAPLGAGLLAGIIGAFAAARPSTSVRLGLDPDGADVTLGLAGSTDVKRGGGFRRTVVASRWVAAATPAVANGILLGDPAPLVICDDALVPPLARLLPVGMRSRSAVQTADVAGSRAAILGGAGVGLLPAPFIRQEVEEGALKLVFGDLDFGPAVLFAAGATPPNGAVSALLDDLEARCGPTADAASQSEQSP